MTVTQRKTLHAILLLALLCIASGGGRSQSRTADDMAVVVNPSTPVSDLTLLEVRKIFRGDRQYWSKDVPVVLLIRAPRSRERDVVLRTLYEMSEAQFKQYWIAKIFRAEATAAPKIVYSNNMAKELVTVIPGAIAFLPESEVTDGLKVVKINGRMPGDRGYPLK